MSGKTRGAGGPRCWSGACAVLGRCRQRPPAGRRCHLCWTYADLLAGRWAMHKKGQRLAKTPASRRCACARDGRSIRCRGTTGRAFDTQAWFARSAPYTTPGRPAGAARNMIMDWRWRCQTGPRFCTTRGTGGLGPVRQAPGVLHRLRHGRVAGRSGAVGAIEDRAAADRWPPAGDVVMDRVWLPGGLGHGGDGLDDGERSWCHCIALAAQDCVLAGPAPRRSPA